MTELYFYRFVMFWLLLAAAFFAGQRYAERSPVHPPGQRPVAGTASSPLARSPLAHSPLAHSPLDHPANVAVRSLPSQPNSPGRPGGFSGHPTDWIPARHPARHPGQMPPGSYPARGGSYPARGQSPPPVAYPAPILVQPAQRAPRPPAGPAMPAGYSRYVPRLHVMPPVGVASPATPTGAFRSPGIAGPPVSPPGGRTSGGPIPSRPLPATNGPVQPGPSPAPRSTALPTPSVEEIVELQRRMGGSQVAKILDSAALAEAGHPVWQPAGESRRGVAEQVFRQTIRDLRDQVASAAESSGGFATATEPAADSDDAGEDLPSRASEWWRFAREFRQRAPKKPVSWARLAKALQAWQRDRK